MIKKKKKGRPVGTLRPTKYPVKWPVVGLTIEQDEQFSSAAKYAGKSKADYTRDALTEKSQ
jgi:hypothetical protein